MGDEDEASLLDCVVCYDGNGIGAGQRKAEGEDVKFGASGGLITIDHSQLEEEVGLLPSCEDNEGSRERT